MTNNNHKELSTGHSYDGIEEKDNPMPTWWIWSFLLTIIFGALYYIHFTSGAGEDSYTEHVRLKKEHDAYYSQFKSKSSPTAEADFDQLLAANSNLELAKAAYQRNCQACHADQMQGLIGPNLLDAYWIHGSGQAKEIYVAIDKGFPDKGMPAWGPLMKTEEVYALTAYILAKRGETVANSKAPQGEHYPDYIKK